MYYLTMPSFYFGLNLPLSVLLKIVLRDDNFKYIFLTQTLFTFESF